jgi:hypothetical protein
VHLFIARIPRRGARMLRWCAVTHRCTDSLGCARMLRWYTGTDTYDEMHVHPSKRGGWVHQKAFPLSNIFPLVGFPRGPPCTPAPSPPCTADESVHHRSIPAPPLAIRAMNTCTDTNPTQGRTGLGSIHSRHPSHPSVLPTTSCPECCLRCLLATMPTSRATSTKGPESPS